MRVLALRRKWTRFVAAVSGMPHKMGMILGNPMVEHSAVNFHTDR